MSRPLWLACEGETDRAVARRLAAEAGFDPVSEQVAGGKAALLERLPAILGSARSLPWLVLVDLDRDADCAPPFVAEIAVPIPRSICLRVAVHAVEAWLLADRGGMARFLGVPPTRLPLWPEEDDNPVGALVAAARRSRRRTILRGIPPRPGSGRRKGPEYVPLVEEFIRDHWDLDAAAARAPSLARARRCLDGLALATEGLCEPS